MSRGILGQTDLERISKETPDLSVLQDLVLRLSPDVLSMNYHPASPIPIASVYFRAALDLLTEARYALHEVFAHRIWYLQKKDPPNEITAAFFGRFYADDAALRLYSAGEQYLVDAIKKMLEIKRTQLAPCKKRIEKQHKTAGEGQRKITRLEIIGDFLSAQETVYPFTEAITSLKDLEEWKTTVDYRNRWVHEQPPTVAGMGIVHRRGKRWKQLPNGGNTLGLGGGDEPEYSTEGLVGFIKPAMFQFKDTLTSVVRFYIEILQSQGVSFGD